MKDRVVLQVRGLCEFTLFQVVCLLWFDAYGLRTGGEPTDFRQQNRKDYINCAISGILKSKTAVKQRHYRLM